MAKKQQFESEGKTYTVVEKKPFYKKWWFWLLAVIVIAGIYGAGKDKDTSTVENKPVATTDQAASTTEETTPAEEEPAAPEYEITDTEYVEEDFSKYVTGVLKNNSDKDKSYLQITFPYTDADGNKLGTAIDNISELKAGETWKFKAIILETSDQEVKVDVENPEISGW